MIGFCFLHLVHDRPRNLLRDIVELFLYGVGTVVTRATLDCINRRVWNQLQNIACLETDVLYAQVTRHLVGNLAE